MNKHDDARYEHALDMFEKEYRSGGNGAAHLMILQSIEKRGLHIPTIEQKNRLRLCLESPLVVIQVTHEKNESAGVMATPSDSGKRGAVAPQTDALYASKNIGANGRRMDGGSFR